jgi:hypothetical protein
LRRIAGAEKFLERVAFLGARLALLDALLDALLWRRAGAGVQRQQERRHHRARKKA